ncbi:fibronectin type III domain-containing protein [Paenibacillus oenotherae]|uniref:Fibronectin type III domain-containing protein n=1 Tax=Paenibacillus oenotherae TaxID=1435645 RepID=A0ABS7D645_9BACL|nr:carbohydrate binding domain-containing protein [Paenibacillus oenotherae]MBW7475414.1 fibronectin type III domain-containing protein [Paenibacillus oenotherae]
MMVKRTMAHLIMTSAVFLSIAALDTVPVLANGEEPSSLAFPDEIVVKFKPDANLPYQDGVEPEVGEDDGLRETLSHYPSLTFNRLFRNYDLQALPIESSASVFQRYFTVPVPEGADPGNLLERLNQSGVVEEAYLKPKPVEDPGVIIPNSTPVQPGDDSNFSSQLYANAGPLGHDAPYAWQFEGGDGKGIQWVDIERGWAFNHEDLAAHQIQMLPGSTIFPSSADHGTAVLGVVSAVDNAIGNIGLANKAKPMVSSTIRAAGGYNIAEAILVAVDALQRGDVILLEAQTSYSTANGYVPIEVYPAEFDAIRYAVDQGITVVEAGGNGSVNLNNFQTIDGKYILNQSSADFRDSGAIMVGASSSSVPHTRLYFSNYGNRIDVNSWGFSVHTLAAASPSATTGYQSDFSGTSSASAIVTSSVISIQGIAKAQFGAPYAPDIVRNLLRNPAFNTPTGNPAVDQIGNLPNLKGIIDQMSPPVVDSVAPSMPSNLTVSGKTTSIISLAWSAATDNIGVVRYEVWRDNLKIGTSTATSFTDTGLTPGTAYSYTVKAVDAAGNLSAASASLSVATDNPNTVTVYYKHGYSTPYIHYRPVGGTWTTAPGTSLSPSEVPGYSKLTIAVGTATSLEAVFNDGNNNWDNNYGNNYIFPLGISTIDNGYITSGAPVANNVTIYYKQGYSTPYIHYRPSGGAWTTAPGAAMPASEIPGYNKLTINVGTAVGLEAAFNNGNGTWDNNHGSNYYFSAGTFTFNAGTITSGMPTANTVTIYYKRGYSTPYIHWRPEGGVWTPVPGQAMPSSEVAGYSKVTLTIGAASRAEVCFNNGSGAWDNNSGRNYFINKGTFTFNNGSITSGSP